MFVAYNAAPVGAGAPVRTVPAEGTSALTSVSFDATITAGTFEFNVGWAGLPVPDEIHIFASPPVSAGRKFNANYRYLTASTGAATNADYAEEYQARFGTPLVGQRIFIRAVAYKHGGSLPTAERRYDGLVTAGT